MSKTETALKLALEALEEAWYHVGTFQPTEKAIDLYDEARAAIREALAQPEQEPFGYFRYDLRLDAWVQNREGQRPGTPFYTTPPQRKPLTEKEIDQITEQLDETTIGWSTHEFARAIEAAHGIKE